MDINIFNDPNEIPQPRHKIKITQLQVSPYPDRFRIYIELRVTAFQERPNLVLVVKRMDGLEVGELNIIETMHHKMEFTMHIRNVEDPAGEYEITAELFYETRNPAQDRKHAIFQIPEA
ncbi:hypothetical protein MASR2M15_20050 [Anaerolineales bacterium]